MTLLLVIVGAAVGAPMRYLTDKAVQSRHDTAFPWGTFTVNVLACLVLGAVTGAVLAGSAGTGTQALVGTGFCGGYTTFSTASAETVRLAQRGAVVAALGNAVGTLVLAVGAGALGLLVTR